MRPPPAFGRNSYYNRGIRTPPVVNTAGQNESQAAEAKPKTRTYTHKTPEGELLYLRKSMVPRPPQHMPELDFRIYCYEYRKQYGQREQPTNKEAEVFSQKMYDYVQRLHEETKRKYRREFERTLPAKENYTNYKI